MEILNPPFNTTLLVATGIFLSSLPFLFLSIDRASQSINLQFWMVGFTGLYLGGGGLFSLLTAQESELQELFSRYNITTDSAMALIPWFIFCMSSALVCKFFPTVFSLGFFLHNSLESSRSLVCKFFLFFYFGIMMILYIKGDLGYQGYQVGTDNSKYEINPYLSILSLLFLGIGPLTVFFLWINKNDAFYYILTILVLIIGMTIGRRWIVAIAISSVAIYWIFSKQFLASKGFIVSILAAGLCLYFITSFFFYLRLASYELSNTGKERSLIILAPKAFSLFFTKDIFERTDSAFFELENKRTRPFYPLGYFCYVTDLFFNGLGFKGELSIANLKSVIPRTFYPNKDLFLDSAFEEESFVARKLGIPSTDDEAPTPPTSGLINFGLFGVFLQVILYTVVLGFILLLLKYLNIPIFSGIFGMILVTQLQFSETNFVTFLETLRATVLFFIPLFLTKLFYNNLLIRS